MKLLGNSRDPKTVKNMSPGDSSLRTGLILLAFVTSENELDIQKCFITSHIHVVGWVIKPTITFLVFEILEGLLSGKNQVSVIKTKKMWAVKHLKHLETYKENNGSL